MAVMNSNKINKAEMIIEGLADDNKIIKKVKKDRGLMERSEVEQKIILEEDNRQVIFG